MGGGSFALSLVLISAAACAHQRDGAHAGRTDTTAFFAAWVREASIDIGPGGDTAGPWAPTDVRMLLLKYDTLTGVRDLPRPSHAVGTHWRGVLLDSTPGKWVVLWTPTDSLPLSWDAACDGAVSLLGAEPFAAWGEVSLNPYCDETYGPDEVDLALYWLPGAEWPLIDVTINGPACVPSDLLRHDPAAGRYVLAREACAS